MLHHLTFGRNIKDNDYVTDVDWQMYCDEVLDSHFDGYMVTDANGCWKSQHELTKQVSIETVLVSSCTDFQHPFASVTM